MKTKRFFWALLALLIVTALALTACGPEEAETPEEPAEEPKFKACQVTDTGGIDDKSFNASAWKGVTDAIAAFDIEDRCVDAFS